MWINTRVEFKWDGTQYAEVACEGYEYSGEIAQCQEGPFPEWDQYEYSGNPLGALLGSLGLTEGQAGLLGDDFYDNLSKMFPDIPRKTIEQFIMQPQMDRYETLLGQLREQRAQEQAFLSEEYRYRGDELQRQIDAQEAQLGFVETGYDITTADIADRKQEEVDRLGITTDALDRRLIEEADRLGITKDELERQKYAVGEELRITEADISKRETEAKNAAQNTRDELAEQLDDAKSRYGEESPQ